MVLPTLAAERESDFGPYHTDVTVAQCRQPVRAVFLPVLIIADPDPRLFQEADDGRQYLLPRQTVVLEITVGALADLRECLGKGEHGIVLNRVADLAPPRAIAILLSAPRVSPARLQVSAGIRTDPDVGPGRRDGEALDPADGFRVADGVAVAGKVAKCLADALPPDPWGLVGNIAQPRDPGRLHRVDQLRRVHGRPLLPRFRDG